MEGIGLTQKETFVKELLFNCCRFKKSLAISLLTEMDCSKEHFETNKRQMMRKPFIINLYDTIFL